jgi:hypothetical protein
MKGVSFMTAKDVFKVWAPTGVKWVDWVRPVQFMALDDNFKSYEVSEFLIPTINYINKVSEDTAIIVDLEGDESIKEGIALAKIGFRPIPIYNGTDPQEGAMATVDNNIVESGLIKGAIELVKINIPDNAPPAFLADSKRMHRFKMNESIFDNSWDIYPQDIPSAKYFLGNGIDKIIIVGKKVENDLAKILNKFQQEGIEIYFTKGFEEPEKIIIKS